MIAGSGAHGETDKHLFGFLLRAKLYNKTFPPLVVKDITLPPPTSLFSTSTGQTNGLINAIELPSLEGRISTAIEGILLSEDVAKTNVVIGSSSPITPVAHFTRARTTDVGEVVKQLVTSEVTTPSTSENLKQDLTWSKFTTAITEGRIYNISANLNPALKTNRDSDSLITTTTMAHEYTGNGSMAGNMNTTTSATPAVGNKFHTRLLLIFDRLKAICREKQKTIPPPEIDGPYCNRTVDWAGGCWPDTPAGSVAMANCPDIPGYNDKALMTRNCTADGTWYVDYRTNKIVADYSNCQLPDGAYADDTKYIYIFIGGFILSMLMLLVSLGIFFRFRQLRCDRITIHKNLFISYIFTGISWILYYVFAALDGDVLLANPVWCRSLHIMCQYFTVCNFMWMFCEGLYLNTIMVYAFSSGKTLIICCYLVGWGLPVILTTVYTAVRSSVHIAAMDCWLWESALQWIMYGPIVLSLVINIIFLINIVRLLITKLRQMPEVAQTRKAVRATLILVPLLGLQYLLFPIRPGPGSELEDFYHTVVALLISLQGAFVSVMYCFCNGEVISVVRRKWNQHKLMSKSSIRNTSVHGGTTYTTVDHDHTQANTITYYSTSDNKDPPLEMAKIDKEGQQ